MVGKQTFSQRPNMAAARIGEKCGSPKPGVSLEGNAWILPSAQAPIVLRLHWNQMFWLGTA